MYIIAGLGNPTYQYAMTRHNVGFRVIEELAQRNNIALNNSRYKAISGAGTVGGRKALLLLPQTYMNLSGDSIAEAVNFYKIDVADELLVVYDDISLDIGQLRIRAKGSAGGHNGIKSIIARLGTMDFMRIKVGVGEKPEGWDLADYVLSRFSDEEAPVMDEGITNAARAAEILLSDGIETAMNQYNKKRQS